MPAWIETAAVAPVSWLSADATLADMAYSAAVIREIWDAQSFSDLLAGTVRVPDDVMNQALTAMLAKEGPVRELRITSLANHQIRIDAKTTTHGRVRLQCRVEQLEHNQVHSWLKLKVIGKKLPDRPLLSWIFSRVSLAMVSKTAGLLDPESGLAVAVDGNDICVDFRQALYRSALGGLTVLGYRPLDALTIYSLTPQAGYVEVHAGLNLPDSVKILMKSVWAWDGNRYQS